MITCVLHAKLNSVRMGGHKDITTYFSHALTYIHSVINPRSAQARVKVVDLSVCRRFFWHYRLQGGLLAIPAASELCEPEKYKGNFPEMTAFERYTMKTSKEANMHNHTGLLRPDLLALCTLGGQEVTTDGMYRLAHAIYYCR